MTTYLALATDYDGTIARHNVVDESTLAALARFKQSGRRLILVTGRILEELRDVCPRLDLFDRVVAENGALFFRPEDGSEVILAPPHTQTLVDALNRKGVMPISVGRVIIATWKPHDIVASEVIRSMGLDLQVILNKRAVMILPSGVDKASGLKAALDDLGISPTHAVAVGDAENDLALLELCGFGAAVANAVEPLKQRADLVLQRSHGEGVAELIDRLMQNRSAAK